MKIISMFETIMSQKGKAVALFVVLAFAVAGLTAVTSLSDSSVVAQGLGNVSDLVCGSAIIWLEPTSPFNTRKCFRFACGSAKPRIRPK